MNSNLHLKQARELRGWSQAKVAEQIGTDATTVSRWERGLFFPTPYFREKLCTLFDKNAEELGLLENCHKSSDRAYGDSPLPTPITLSALQTDEEQAPEETCTEQNETQPIAPANTYTFHIYHDSGKRGIALALLIISAFLLGGLSFKGFYVLATSPSTTAHTLLASKTAIVSQDGLPHPSSTSTIPHSTPTTTLASTMPKPVPTVSSSSSLAASTNPTNLNPQTCILEPIGYKCDLQLWLYTYGQPASSWHWQAGPATLPAQFTPFQGTGQAGQPCQLTLYIHSTQGQQGRLTFILSSLQGSTTAVVSWQG